MLHSSQSKASAFPFRISGLKRFSFLPAHLLARVRLKLPVTRSPPTLGYGLVVSLCPTGFSPALCNDLAQPHGPSLFKDQGKIAHYILVPTGFNDINLAGIESFLSHPESFFR